MRQIIEACRPVDVQDGIAVLGFPEDRSFLRDVAERKKAILEEALARFLGAPIGVRCVVANVELAAADQRDEDDPGDLVEHAKRIFAGDLVDVGEIS